MTIQEARSRAEEKTKIVLSESEFQKVQAYARHKAMVNGKGEDYVPLLLYDEIRNYVFRNQFNKLSHEFNLAIKSLQGRTM